MELLSEQAYRLIRVVSFRAIPLRLLLAVIAAASLIACSKITARDHTARGNTYFSDKKFPEAIIEFRAALQQDPNLGDVRLKLAGAYLATNDLKGALGE